MKHPKRACALMILAAALAVCMLAGCNKNEAYQPEMDPAQVSTPTIGEDGVLRVGVNTSRPPLAGSGSNKIVGIDVDIAAALAENLGLQLSIVDVGSDPQSAIDNNTVDIVMGINQSEAADYTFWLSPSYLPTAVSAFGLSSDVGVPVANTPSATFAAQVSSKSAWAVTNEFGTDALTSTNSLADAFSDLETNVVNYVAADAIIGMYTAHGRDLEVSIVALMSPLSGYSIGVSAANADLQTAITNALTTVQGSGIISLIERKWLGTELDLSNIPLTAGANTTATGTTDVVTPPTDGTTTDGTNPDGTPTTDPNQTPNQGDATTNPDNGAGDTGTGNQEGTGDTTGEVTV